MHLFRTLLTLAMFSTATCYAQGQTEFSIPKPAEADDSLALWATHYYVHSAPAVSTGIAFTSRAGVPVSDTVSPRDWCLGAIEGTVRVTFNGEPRTLNFAGVGTKSHVDCAAVLRQSTLKNPWIGAVGKTYFAQAKGAYGDGVRGFRLVPFRTVAVDKQTIPFGSVIYISAARDVEVVLPSGETVKHDGYFFAGDTGGAIKGEHIDVFCGITNKNCLPAVVKNSKESTFKATIVRDPHIVKLLTDMHRP